MKQIRVLYATAAFTGALFFHLSPPPSNYVAAQERDYGIEARVAVQESMTNEVKVQQSVTKDRLDRIENRLNEISDTQSSMKGGVTAIMAVLGALQILGLISPYIRKDKTG